MTEDWRIRGQDRYLMGAALSRKKWTKRRAEWDHDHCAFCWKKFSEQPADTHEGYATADEYYWVCDECFADFMEKFKWKVAT